MTKTQLTEALAAELGVSKKLAAELVNCFIENVIMNVVTFKAGSEFKAAVK